MTQANDDATASTGPPTGEPAPNPEPRTDGPAQTPVPPAGAPVPPEAAGGPVQAPVPMGGGPVRAPVPPQAGGPLVYPPLTAYGPAPGQPPYYGPPAYGWRPPPVPLAPGGRPLADFGTRLLAYLIDSAILGGIMAVVLMPVMFVVIFNLMPNFSETVDGYGPAMTPETMFDDFLVPLVLIELGFFLLLLVGYYVYYVEMMYRGGQTVGKRALKIKVVPLDPAATLTRGMAAKRYLLEFIAGSIVPFLGYVDGLWQLWDKPYQQTLHDKVAKTVVIKVAP